MSGLTDFYEGTHGSILAHCGLRPPPGFLTCDGKTYDRVDYAALFAAITLQPTGDMTEGSAVISNLNEDVSDVVVVGMPISGLGIPVGATVSAITASTLTLSLPATLEGDAVTMVIAPFGVGDSSSTFNVPDLRGRMPAGHDSMGGTAANRLTAAGAGVAVDSVGIGGGSQTHVLAATEMPAHSHAVSDPGHGHGVGDPGHSHGVSDPGHAHSLNGVTMVQNGGTPFDLGGNGSGGASGGSATTSNGSGIGIAASGSGISIGGAVTGISLQNTGGGVAHTIVQPFLAVNYFIKT